MKDSDPIAESNRDSDMVTAPYRLEDLTLIPGKEGARNYTKVSYPITYGRYSEIRTGSHIFQFNLNGEIKTIKGMTFCWPNPLEWLKRTTANDWVYYSAGGYTGVYDALGEYYLPCFDYPSNIISNRNPFKEDAVKSAITAWKDLLDTLEAIPPKGIPECLRPVLADISGNGPERLREKTDELQEIIGDRPSVLPPDTRHVDYDVIPVIIADGCLYNCGFCAIKSGRKFTPRTPSDITEQVNGLKTLYDRDLVNYNSIFLGQHDALLMDRETIEFAAMKAYETFEFEKSYMKGANLFMFGSPDSFLRSSSRVFDALNRLPFQTYINIGLESADNNTLRLIKKGIDAKSVERAFRKMLEINERYENIEITVNFLLDDSLPENHLRAFLSLSDACARRFHGKGAVYFSPLYSGASGERAVEGQREFLSKFFKIKNQSRLPTYIYLIQRL